MAGYWLGVDLGGTKILSGLFDDNLKLVANAQSADTQRRAGRLKSDLEFGRIDEILATGVHAYLTHFLDRVNDIGAGISRDFLVPA